MIIDQERNNRIPITFRPELHFLWKEALVILLCLAVPRIGGSPGAIFIGIVLLVWGLLSSKTALQSLTLLVIISYLNPQLMHFSFPPALKWLVLITIACAAIYHCWRNNTTPHERTIPRWLLAFTLFFLVTLTMALVGPTAPEIAVFKLLTFAIGMLGVMAIYWDHDFDLGYSLSWCYTVYLVIVFTSAPLALSPLGYFPTSSLFQGIFNQSQAYGVYIAPCTALLIICWLTGQFALSWLGKIGCMLGVVTLYLSNCRTAGYAIVISLLLIYLFGFLRRGDEARILSRHVLPVTILLFLLFTVDLASQGHLYRVVTSFVNKNGATTTTMLGSRESKVQEALDAFTANWLTGVGFGMNMNQHEALSVERDPLLGLPVSAPVEAGVMYAALPAQIGMLGLIPFLLFLCYFARPILRAAPLPLLGLFFCALLVNFGEYIFFSIGGLGMAIWPYFALTHRVSVVCGQTDDH